MVGVTGHVLTLILSPIQTFYTMRVACPCDLYPLTPHFYIGNLRFTRVFISFLLIFALKQRLWVLNRGVLTCTQNLKFMFNANI